MVVKLERLVFNTKSTYGKMYIDGVFKYHTIEDTVRDKGVKVYGETAIPAGKYEMSLSMSNRFKRILPEIHNVPGFEGIRIHRGNTAKDSHGCILIGKSKANNEFISNSTAAEVEFVELMKKAGGKATIGIVNK